MNHTSDETICYGKLLLARMRARALLIGAAVAAGMETYDFVSC